MIDLPRLRSAPNRIVVFGNHSDIIQSILDFDYLCHKKEGSVIGVVSGRRGFAKYFFGRREILLPTFPTPSDLPPDTFLSSSNLWFLNLLSGRRTLSSVTEFLDHFPRATGGALFAENVPELHSLEILARNHSSRKKAASSHLLIGPASVGLVVPGHLKLGAIGGITPTQITSSHLTKPGHLAVMSASGGMTNELISLATGTGHLLSFALSFGGDRFPILSPRDAFLLAAADPETSAVLYYGELGGEDEYELVKLKQAGIFNKPVIAHIAGTVSSLFPEAPQFGHAKAKENTVKDSARAKRHALKEAGFFVSDSFTDFIKLVTKLK